MVTQNDESHAPLLDSTAGWIATGATFVSTFTVFGVAYSFGEFFGPMADEFGTDRTQTSLIFAITTFLYFLLGAVTGHIADKRGARPVLVFGAAAITVGLLLTAEVSSIEVGYATYGLGVGIGVACAYVPMVAAVGGWFVRRRAAAVGLAVAGIGVGTLTVVPIAGWLISELGWRQTYRWMALASGVLLLLAAVGAKRPPITATGDEPSPWRRLADADARFWILYVSIVFVSMALFTPFVYMADFVDTEGIDGSAAVLVGIIGVASVVGRLGLGALASFTSPVRLYQVSLGVMAASFVVWLTLGSTYSALVVFAVILGASYGGFIALSPVVTAHLFGISGLGATLGALYTAAGFGGLFGPPLVGYVIDGFGFNRGILAALISGFMGTALLALPQINRPHPSTP